MMTWQYRGPITGRNLGSDYIHLSERDIRIIKGQSPIPLTEKYKGNRSFDGRLDDPRSEFHRAYSPTDSEVEEWWEQAEEMMVEGMLYMNRRKLATFTPTRSAFRKWNTHDETQPALKVTFSTEHTTVYYRLFNHELLGTRKPEVHYARRFDCYQVLDDDVSKIFDKLAEEDEEYLYGPDPNDIKLEPEQKGQKLEATKQAPTVSAKAVMDELLKTGTPPFMFHPLSPPAPAKTPLRLRSKCTIISRKGAIPVASLEPNLSPISSTVTPALTIPKEYTRVSTNPAPGCQSATNESTTYGLANDFKHAPAMDDTPTAATTPRKEIDEDLPIRKPVINSWLGDDATGTIKYRSRRDRELETDACEDEKAESESHLVVASTSNDHNSDKATDTDGDEESIGSVVTLITDFAINDMLNDVKETPEEEMHTGINCGTSPTLLLASMSSSTSSTSMPKRLNPLELRRFPHTPTPRPFHNMLKRSNYLKFFSPNIRIAEERTLTKPPKTSIQSAFHCMFACVSKQ